MYFIPTQVVSTMNMHGQLGDPFHLSKSIKQGWLLSPYMCMMVVDALGSILSIALDLDLFAL
jgi:hypothetical protein